GRNDQHQRRRTATSAVCRCPPQFAVRLLDRLEGDQFGELARDIWRRSSAGVTSTIPTRDFASPSSISRSNGEPRTTSFSLNQTETPSDSSRSYSSFAGLLRSSPSLCKRV